MADTNDDHVMSDDIEFEDDVEAELEVDELDPSDDEAAAAAPVVSPRKASSRKPGVRTPGRSLLPATRVENILQANGITSNLAMSKEGQFMLSIATEEFIKQLAKYALEEAERANTPNVINYANVALVPIVVQPEFAFLQEIIPRSMPIKYAMEFRERRLKELEDEDPALGGYIPPSYNATPLFPPSASTTSSKPAKSKKEKQTNGKEKEKQTNGTSASAKSKKSASAKTSRSASVSSRASKNEVTTGQRKSNRNGKHHPVPSPLVNGHVDDNDTNPDSDMVVDPTGDDSPWSSQPIGPASGYIQGSAGELARSASTSSSNPGRTIYSQSGQPD